MPNEKYSIDATDILILRALQSNAHLTVKELAAKVNLSTTPVFERVKRLERDGIIDRYADKPVPKGVGCVMLELTNIRYINGRFGHAQGNVAIRDFSNILKMSSVSLCFVGRNGGNKFLAVFEESDRQQIDRFLERIDQKIEVYNAKNSGKPLDYACGIAFDEPEEMTITQLVALADRRIRR